MEKAMNLKRFSVPFVALLMLGVFALVASAASGTTNGDFETGDLTGWEVFTTSNGTGSSPTVEQIDIANIGVMTNAVVLSVGQVVPEDGGCGSDADCRNADLSIFEGAGVRQPFQIDAGGETVYVSANVAVKAAPNADAQTGGFFELMIDDTVVDSFLFTDVAAGATMGETIEATVPLQAGDYMLSVRATRPWETLGMNSDSPMQLIDEVFVVETNAPPPTPEPTATPEPEPTATQEPRPLPEPTFTPVPATATPEPEPEPTVIPEPTATPKPTKTPEPTVIPEPTGTPKPSDEPDDDDGTHGAPSDKPGDDDADDGKNDDEFVPPGLKKLHDMFSGSDNRFAALIEMLLEWLARLFKINLG